MNHSRVTLHQDGTVTYWDGRALTRVGPSAIDAEVLAKLSGPSRARVKKHIEEHAARTANGALAPQNVDSTQGNVGRG